MTGSADAAGIDGRTARVPAVGLDEHPVQLHGAEPEQHSGARCTKLGSHDGHVRSCALLAKLLGKAHTMCGGKTCSQTSLP
jgi:hypothetical protein